MLSHVLAHGSGPLGHLPLAGSPILLWIAAACFLGALLSGRGSK